MYHGFILDFPKLTYPLNKFLMKGDLDQFEVYQKELCSFHAFTEAVCMMPVVVLPQRGLYYSVDTDAHDYGTGCTLFQTHHNRERKPLGFWSRILNDAERHYSAMECKCLRVVQALKPMRPYFMCEKFVVHSDHHILH